MRLYYLIDNCKIEDAVVYRSRFMDDKQLAEEQQKCIDYAAGEFIWVAADKQVAELPKDEIFSHVPISLQ